MTVHEDWNRAEHEDSRRTLRLIERALKLTGNPETRDHLEWSAALIRAQLERPDARTSELVEMLRPRHGVLLD